MIIYEVMLDEMTIHENHSDGMTVNECHDGGWNDAGRNGVLKNDSNTIMPGCLTKWHLTKCNDAKLVQMSCYAIQNFIQSPEKMPRPSFKNFPIYIKLTQSGLHYFLMALKRFIVEVKWSKIYLMTLTPTASRKII